MPNSALRSLATSSTSALRSTSRRAQCQLTRKTATPSTSRIASRARCFSSTSAARFSGHETTIGVEAALRAASDPTFKPRATILSKEFSLEGRVAIVTGAHQGLGLEMAEALAEAGATTYCLDLQEKPGETWEKTKQYVDRIDTLPKNARMEYKKCDVTDQKQVWDTIGGIARHEGRLDACVAAAGILRNVNVLDYTAEEFEEMMHVNVNGVMYTAQAAAREMTRLGTPGSITLIASMSGSVANKGQHYVAYNASKGAVITMSRAMACELGELKIRVNTLSPGYIYTALSAEFLDKHPNLVNQLGSENPLGRLGKPHELRGAVTWLASDASTFCTGSDILVTGGHHSW